MNKLLQDSSGLPRAFAIFLVVMTLVSIFGGYQLSRLVYKINDFSLQRTDRLLVVEESMDEAAIALGGQIQEWKDMLLRANDAELYGKHQKAFMNSSIGVQEALLRTKTAMQNIGLDTGEIDQLSLEHKSLVSNYLLAQAKLDPRKMEFSHEVDRQVIGVDRNLQQHLAAVKADMEHLAQQQLTGTMSTQNMHYWLVGLLGAVGLLIMALIGFLFASRFYGHETGAGEHLSAA